MSGLDRLGRPCTRVPVVALVGALACVVAPEFPPSESISGGEDQVRSDHSATAHDWNGFALLRDDSSETRPGSAVELPFSFSDGLRAATDFLLPSVQGETINATTPAGIRG